MPINKGETSYFMDLSEDLEDIPQSKQKKALKEAGEVARESILDYTSKRNSPVSKGEYEKKLSARYREEKKRMGKGGVANLRLKEKMLNSLRVGTRGNGFRVYIHGNSKKNLAKSHGHNSGGYGFDKEGPKRQFLPDDSTGEKFKPNIRRKIKETLEKYKRKKR